MLSTQALVNVYEDLLKFYLEIMALFEDSKYVLRVAMELFKPKIADIVSSFKTHVDAQDVFGVLEQRHDGEVELE